MGKVALAQAFYSITLVFPCKCYSSNAIYSSSSAYCSYLIVKRGMSGDFSKKDNAFLEIRGHCVEKYFYIFRFKKPNTWITFRVPFCVKRCVVLG